MNKEILVFSTCEIDKCKFHYPKNPVQTDDVDTDKTLISNKVSLGKNGYRCFIGNRDNDYKIKPLCIMLRKMSGYIKRFDETIYFFIKMMICKTL